MHQQQLHDTIARVARGLANGHRLALLERLAQGEASVEALASAAGLTFGNASQHLQQLRQAGLVTSRRAGKQVIYRLSDEEVVNLLAQLRRVAENNLAEMAQLVGTLFAGEGGAADALQPMSRDALLRALQDDAVMLVDVRPEEEYRAGHLPQALNMPLDQLEQMLSRLPREREIVAYCRGPYCTLSHEAVQRLRAHGFVVRRYEEGFPEWKAAGLPVSGRRAIQ